MSEVDLAQAQAIVAHALSEAAGRGMAGVSVVVTDPGGALRASARSDGAGPFGVDIALAKARTALGFRRSSIKTAAVFGDKPAIVTGLNAAVGSAFLPLGGGVVIVGAGGDPIGAAGVAGGLPEVDHEIVAGSVAAAGLAILE
jgi:uncharacterized protein GlcG (DUF336 family)